jgi:hypothetical protein
LHRASFFVWLGAMSVHVLMRIFRVLPILRRPLLGTALRLGLAGASLAVGLTLATLTLPAADRLQDNLSSVVGLDAR